MRGTVTKVERKSGYMWRARIDLPRGPDGERRRRSKVFETETEAEAWLAEINHEINTGAVVEPSEMSLRQYLQKWLDTYGETHLKSNTRDRYRQGIETHILPKLGDTPLKDLTPMAIDSLYTYLLTEGRKDDKDGGLSPATVKNAVHSPLRRALHMAVEKGLLNQNPADAVEAPQPDDKEMKTLTGPQVQTFLKVARETSRLSPIYHLALLTGMRRGELLGLRWKDVDLSEGRLTVNQNLIQKSDNEILFTSPKTKGSRRTLHLPPPAVRVLREQRERQDDLKDKVGDDAWKDERGLVFTANNGAPLRPRNLYRDFKKLLDRTDLPDITFHDLRHTCATLLLEQNEHPKVVQKMLGHESIQTTLDTYSHVSDELQQRASQRLAAAVMGTPQDQGQIQEA